MARNSSLITSRALDESLAPICSIVAVNRMVPLKMPVSPAKKQKINRAIKWFISRRRSAVPHSGLSFSMAMLDGGLLRAWPGKTNSPVFSF
jgi:hypothetical protein